MPVGSTPPTVPITVAPSVLESPNTMVGLVGVVEVDEAATVTV